MSDRAAKQGLTVGLLMAIGAGALAAQSRLTGTVRDTTGAPIAGVEISATGLQRTATTDRSGAFRLDGIPVGSATITARRLGYAPQSTVLKIAAGENSLPDIVLTVIPRELDTVSTREQQLWRERPLLREFEENRRLGMGQFITRAEFARNQGGFISPMVEKMRGVIVVRGGRSGMWIANRYIPVADNECTTLEGLDNGGIVTPAGANCRYCFPDVYLDYTRISSRKTAPNIGSFSPDALEAMEVYLGGAETPMRYASGLTACGVVVLHTRAVGNNARRIAAAQNGPTRSRFLANVSASAGHPDVACYNCGLGSTFVASAGYTFRDRWVLGGQYTRWTGNEHGPQSLSIRTVNVEWYPHPEPARVKWFINAGFGQMRVDLVSQPDSENTDAYKGSRLPTTVLGTGVDVAVLRRFVVTPYVSLARNFGGLASREHCNSQFRSDGTVVTACSVYPTPVQPVFTFWQMGTRFGWR
jgi:hypothetical protein